MDQNRARVDKWLGNLPWLLVILGGLTYLLANSLTEGFLEHWRQRAGILSAVFERTVIKEFSLAIIIAALATLSIERVRVRSWMKEIDDFVRVIAIRGPLPHDYYEHCRRTVIDVGFLQYDWVLTLDFRVLAEDPSFLTFLFDQEYRVKNLETVESEFIVEHFDTRDWDDKWPQYPTRIRYVRVKVDGTDEWLLNLTGAEVNVPDPENPEYLRFRRGVTMAPNGVLFVQEGTVKVMRDREVETIMVGLPTKGISARVECPEDIEVNFTAFHPKTHLAKYTERENVGGGKVRFNWSFSQPLHPWSAIGVDWARKPIAAALTPRQSEQIG